MLHAVTSDGQTFTPSHICASPGTAPTLHDGPETECPVFSQDSTMYVARMIQLHNTAGVVFPVNGDA